MTVKKSYPIHTCILKEKITFFDQIPIKFVNLNFFVKSRKTPLAQFYDCKHSIIQMSYDDKRKYLLTVGLDRVIKVINIYC